MPDRVYMCQMMKAVETTACSLKSKVTPGMAHLAPHCCESSSSHREKSLKVPAISRVDLVGDCIVIDLHDGSSVILDGNLLVEALQRGHHFEPSDDLCRIVLRSPTTRRPVRPN